MLSQRLENAAKMRSVQLVCKGVKFMPGGDGTGPKGLGPMTGRGVGFCAGFAYPGYVRCGMGYGRGRGMGRMNLGARAMGWGSLPRPAYAGAFQPAFQPVDEKESLNNQVAFLENQLQEMKKRLEALGGGSE